MAVTNVVKTYRDGVRIAVDAIESAVKAAADMDAFKALYKVPTENGKVTGKAPIDKWPETA